MMLGAGNGGEELPAGKDADTACGCGFDLHLLFFGVFALGHLDALLAESRMDGG